MSLSLNEIRMEIDELEEKLKTDPENKKIKERLHTLNIYEHHMEEYYAGTL